LVLLLECAIPYEKVLDEGIVVRKETPKVKDKTSFQQWSKALTINELNLTELLEAYQQLIFDIIKADTESFDFIIELIVNTWLPYLYPNIYSKYKENTNAENIGFHPYCPPIIHVRLKSEN